ncbi:LmeA family phospholipid-binding protein [Streptomyces avicenniae]|uniref:LmeA family phospholipid-binding protein n=1 Tax=Streptomyces avicenniae TaxID=500153 RepID=UPI000699CE8A|nr:LmeA family phospholipid-binding protein [Streptomyces avicenniae]
MTPAAATPHAPARRPRRRTVRVTAVVLAALLLLATGAEVLARTVLHRRIAEAAERSLGDGADVSTGGLALAAAVTGRLPYIEVSGDAATVGRLGGVRVQARAEDVRAAGPGATAARTHAEVTVPTAAIGRAARSGDRGLPVGDVTADPAAGTLTVALGDGGLGHVTLRPVLRDGRVSTEVAGAEVLGIPLPAGTTDRIADSIGDLGGDGAYPLGLRPTTVGVTDEGIHVVLDGGPTRLETPGGA